MQTHDFLFARQPIFDKDLEINSYELLFRPTKDCNIDIIDGDRATSQVLINAFNEFHIEDVIGKHKAFINFTRNAILNPPPFDKEHFAIEVLEDVVVDDSIVNSISKLKNEGYTIALDDFLFENAIEPLIQYADIVKLDVLSMDKELIMDHLERLKPYEVKLLAEKVETHEMYDWCKNQGFDLYQGFFFCKPQILEGKTVPASKKVVLELIATLNDSNAEPSDIEGIISKDSILSYKLLRLVNSAAYRRAKPIESLKHAINMLGLTAISSWATLLSLACLSEKPNFLQFTSMVRGEMCRLLTQHIDPDKASSAFTVGLLSTLDAYFDKPMESLLKTVSLSKELEDALFKQEGLIGLIYHSVLQHEQGHWKDLRWNELEEHGITAYKLEAAYMDSLRWAQQTTHLIN